MLSTVLLRNTTLFQSQDFLPLESFICGSRMQRILFLGGGPRQIPSFNGNYQQLQVFCNGERPGLAKQLNARLVQLLHSLMYIQMFLCLSQQDNQNYSLLVLSAFFSPSLPHQKDNRFLLSLFFLQKLFDVRKINVL